MQYANPMEAYRDGRLSAFLEDDPAFKEAVQPPQQITELPEHNYPYQYPEPQGFYPGDQPSYDPRDS